VTTLHKKRLNGNHNIQTTNNIGNFTAYDKLSIIIEYLYKNWISKLIKQEN